MNKIARRLEAVNEYTNETKRMNKKDSKLQLIARLAKIFSKPSNLPVISQNNLAI